MSAVSQRELGIFWETGDGQEEVDGIYVYGYWRGDAEPKPGIPAWAWPSTQAPQFQQHPTLAGPGWRVAHWDVRVLHWPKPEEWEAAVKQTLQAMIDAGARAAWCGLEGQFADPPELFDPKHMSGGIWAALSATTGFKLAAQLDQPFATLPDTDLLELKKEL